MEKQWKTIATIYAILQILKTIWELFSSEPLVKVILDMFNVTSTPALVDFISKYGLLLFSIAILLIIYIPILRNKIFGLEQVINQTFKNKTITLDGKQYIDCIFDNCTFRWNGENYSLRNFKRIGTLGIESQNPTVYNTVDLLKALNFLEKEFSNSWKHLSKEHFN